MWRSIIVNKYKYLGLNWDVLHVLGPASLIQGLWVFLCNELEKCLYIEYYLLYYQETS